MVLLVLLSLLSTCLCLPQYPRDCSAMPTIEGNRPSNEVYTIFPGGPNSPPMQVYCDMETDGGGWTVIQRRMDGSVNFNRPWDHYKKGFGNKEGEYWLGLDNINMLTMRKKNELRVDMEDWEGGKVYAQYTSFSVDAESLGYTLNLGSFIDGGAGDSLSSQDGRKFSTYDEDQDASNTNCAKMYNGGFWYGDCYHANPNGEYGKGKADGIEWYHFRGYDYSLKSISMKIRPVTVNRAGWYPPY